MKSLFRKNCDYLAGIIRVFDHRGNAQLPMRGGPFGVGATCAKLRNAVSELRDQKSTARLSGARSDDLPCLLRDETSR